MNKLKAMVDNKTTETTNNTIEKVKEILKLASPKYDLRKHDSEDMFLTNGRKAALQRGVASVINIMIGKQRKNYFESWLGSEIVNPIIIIRDTYFTIKGSGYSDISIDWDCVAVTNIKHDHNDERFNQYCVSFTACNRDYQILIRINKQLEDYYWYAR